MLWPADKCIMHRMASVAPSPLASLVCVDSIDEGLLASIDGHIGHRAPAALIGKQLKLQKHRTRQHTKCVHRT